MRVKLEKILVGVQKHDPVGSQVPFKDRQLKPVYPLCLSLSTVGNFAFVEPGSTTAGGLIKYSIIY